MSLFDSSLPESRATESHNDWTTTTGSPQSVDTGFSCVADSDLSGQVRRFASDESAASSRQSVGCGCLLGPVATAVNRLYRNSASSMYQRVLVVVSNAISDREHVMRSPTPSLPATSGPTTLAARTPEWSCLWLKRRSRCPPDRAAPSTPCPAAPARAARRRQHLGRPAAAPPPRGRPPRGRGEGGSAPAPRPRHPGSQARHALRARRRTPLSR